MNLKRRALLTTALVLLSASGVAAAVGLTVAGIIATPVGLGVALGALLPLGAYASVARSRSSWTDEVLRSGAKAGAVVLEAGSSVTAGVGGYEGADVWVTLAARVEPLGTAPFEARMTLRLSQATFGMLEVGSNVHVRYDPQDPTRVVLDESVEQLLARRVVPK